MSERAEQKAQERVKSEQTKVERKAMAGEIPAEARRHITGPSIVEEPGEDHSFCKAPWQIISERGTTKMQSCKINQLGTALFVNDRLDAFYGVKRENIPTAGRLMKKTIKEVLDEYPLEV